MSTVGVAVAATFVAPAGADSVLPGTKSRPADTATQPSAVGLIVTTTRTAPSESEVSGIARAAGARSSEVEPLLRGVVTVPFDARVTGDEALAAAAEMEKLPGVVAAEPNYVINRAVASPVPVNDSGFRRQHGTWDARFRSPAGGYSARAPYVWRTTKGSTKVTVAVLDTGYTKHADLDANRVAGYDFVSQEADPFNRDGVAGRDADASDPGDWVGAGQCVEGDQSYPDRDLNSSWHGTHVAGTIAAIDNNNKGVVGVAPNVKFQPIRVLGPCGGTVADIAAAITWASGAAVPGVPTNKTPAKVINLSLGGPGTCDSVTSKAVLTARTRGAVVVAAAGNESTQTQIAPLSVPANCPGVFGVVAADEFGQAAGYSNQGTKSARAKIAAPGGEPSDGYTGIYSTYNSGTTTPGSAWYAELVGTSMATPHVAGAAALLFSLGYNRADAETALVRTVRPFPQYGDEYDCISRSAATTSQPDCGAGLLDLAQVPTVYGSRLVGGTARSGSVVSTGLRPGGIGVKVSYRWYRNGQPIMGATSSKYRLTSADKGKKLYARIAISKSGFRTQTAVSHTRTASR